MNPEGKKIIVATIGIDISYAECTDLKISNGLD